MANYPSPIKKINNLPSSPSYDETVHSTFNLTSTINQNYDKLPIINPSPRRTKNAPRILRKSLEITPKHQIPNLDFIKKQNKLKLNASHHIIRAMVSVEDEKEAIKDKSAFSKSFKRMSAGMKIIIGIKAKKQNLLSQITENLQPVSEKSKVVNNFPKDSYRKWTENNRDAWIRKHCLKAVNNDSKDFAEFLNQLFEALDHENAGFITLTDITVALLALGISRDISYIEKALMAIFKANNLSPMKVEKQQFLEMFKGGLINLVSSFNAAENNLPLRLKLGQEQRKVLSSETKPGLNLSAKHERMVLDSLDKYKQKSGQIDKDLSISLEEAEELSEDRLQRYLYSIRDDARFFLNEKGELISKSKNTWDIREQVRPEKDNDILNSSQKYKKSTYLSILENKNLEEPKKQASLSPKVKLFRENYLWKRYNNLINRFPSH